MVLSSHSLGILSILTGYLLGSIPSGYLAGKWVAGIDLRTIGSGSTGATNVLRQVGKWSALVVFGIDVIKGSLAVLIAKTFQLNDSWEIIAGISALAGHIWPIWLGGKGGKAVATGLGMLLGIAFPVGMASLGIFLTTLTITKIVSLSSVLAAISLPFIMLLNFQGNIFSIPYFTLSLVTTLMVIWRHRSNIKRIRNGTEPRINE